MITTGWRPAQVPLGQAPPPQGAPIVPPVTAGQRQAAVGLGVIHTAFGVAATWVGVRAGMREHGFFSVMGYGVAGVGAIVAAINLLGTLGMASKG
jgi:hypothetical protein